MGAGGHIFFFHFGLIPNVNSNSSRHGMTIFHGRQGLKREALLLPTCAFLLCLSNIWGALPFPQEEEGEGEEGEEH